MICFTWHGIKICVPIFYYQIVDWHPPKPDPRAITLHGVDPEVMRDLQTLAGIRQLSEHLRKETAQPINSAIEGSLKALTRVLPSGVSVELNPQPEVP
jgi:hypothetical protein